MTRGGGGEGGGRYRERVHKTPGLPFLFKGLIPQESVLGQVDPK